MERKNDGNHFWLGALGVLELGFRKQTRNGGQWAELEAELGEIDFGGEVWRQLMVSSSRNFINFKKQERCCET